MKIFLIDIDGTCCEDIMNEDAHLYPTAKVIEGSLEQINKWYDEGNHITFFTAREEKDREVTIKWLNENGFKYHGLVMNKPRCLNQEDEYVWIDNRKVRGITFNSTCPMGKHLKFISSEYLDSYSSKCKIDWLEVFHKLRSKSTFTTDDFEYYLIASSLYSSKIEGNSLDANSFFRNRGNKTFPKKKEVQEIEDLVKAYKFASENNLNKTNFLKTHEISAKTLLPANLRGKVRKQQVGVHDSKSLKPVYLAVEPQFVNEELSKLFADISELLKRDLSYKDVFYYASMIHLWTAKIHPFMDGNGRSARLLEKWFLVSKLGMSAWSINSEKYYWDNRPDYYQNIALGYNYYALYWDRCLPFLLMLPEALTFGD